MITPGPTPQRPVSHSLALQLRSKNSDIRAQGLQKTPEHLYLLLAKPFVSLLTEGQP